MVMAAQLFLREVLKRQEAGEASCLATDGVAARFAQYRANAYLSRAASLLAPVAKQYEHSLFLVRLDRSSAKRLGFKASLEMAKLSLAKFIRIGNVAAQSESARS
jgi:hypothetical protein